jgi:hypothetical protein
MNTGHEPRGSVIWNAVKHRYDWSVSVGDRTITGHAATWWDAHQEISMDWRVRGLQPLRVGRLPRGGIEPPAPP